MLTQGVHMLTQGVHMLTQGVHIECTSEAAETVVAVVATLTTASSGGDKLIQDSIPQSSNCENVTGVKCTRYV